MTVVPSSVICESPTVELLVNLTTLLLVPDVVIDVLLRDHTGSPAVSIAGPGSAGPEEGSLGDNLLAAQGSAPGCAPLL